MDRIQIHSFLILFLYILHKHNIQIIFTVLQGLLPIHCCAMQGRDDVIKILLKADQDGSMRKSLKEEETKTPPSLVHLALANDYAEIAYWFVTY